MLSEGVNTINWVAFNQDYMPDPVPCTAAYANDGPDLVVQYTAQSTGFLEISLAKPASTLYTLLIADGACGTVTPDIDCISEYNASTMGGLIPVFAATTYYFYLTDTVSGAGGLPNPVVVTVEETGCPNGTAGDSCASDGESQCGPFEALGVRAPALPIPDGVGSASGCGSAGAVFDNITITDTQTVGAVTIGLDVTHGAAADLDIFLEFVEADTTSHCVELSSDNGGSGANYAGTVFDDLAATSITTGFAPFTGVYRPEGSLASLTGLAMNGTWTLWVSDDEATFEGTVNYWGVLIDSLDTTIIETCTAAGDGCLDWVQGFDCATGGAYCNAGTGVAQCLTCQDACPLVDDTQCSGEVIDTCTLNAQDCVDWVAGIDCSATGDFCSMASGAAVCVACFDTCPADGDKQCNGTVIETCSVGASGCLEWAVGADCAAVSGQVCEESGGTAACIVCESDCATEGESRCGRDDYIRSSTPALAIPDGGGSATTCGGATIYVADEITTSGSNPINDVNVSIDISHSYVSDLDIFLKFVDDTGTSRCVELSTDNGGSGNDFIDTVFDDEAATAITSGSAPFTGDFRPEGTLSTFDGLSMNGTWTLYVNDDVGMDAGILNDWSLRIANAGAVIETCTLLPSNCRAWVSGTDCAASGDFCEDSSGSASCVACLDACPVGGDTHCSGEVIETCGAGGLGCLEWAVSSDCPAINLGDVCDDSSGTAACVTPLGDDCTTAYPLVFGVNVVAWLAYDMDYMATRPSCQTTGTTLGPDVVMEYTAANSGTIDLIIDKPAFTRYSLVVSEAACGDLTELLCDTEYVATTLGGSFPVAAGSTYFIYITDTDSGSSPLSNPLVVTLGCAPSCPAMGDQQCNGDAIETCQVGALGCLEWQVTQDCSATTEVCEDFGGVTPYCNICNNRCAVDGETQCNAEVIETCSPDGLGCLDWDPGTDCAGLGDICVDGSGSAVCVTAAGSDCADTFVLAAGENEVVWNATTRDYLISAPSCTGSSLTGPDVVAEYTSTSIGAGFVDVTMDKPTSTRYAMVVSDSTCGTVTELACYSDYTNDTMGGRILVTGGTTYYFYVVDTVHGVAPLENPFTLTIDETDCATFSATPSDELPQHGSVTNSLSPVLSVDFDGPIDTSIGMIFVTGDISTSEAYDLMLSPAEVFFTNDDRTLNIDLGFALPAGEQLAVTWAGLQDGLCGNPAGTMTWEFVVVTPSCTPGVGGVVGSTESRLPTGLSSFSEYFLRPDEDVNGWLYFGGAYDLHRIPKAGGTVENVETLAGLSTSHMGYDLLVTGSQIFSLDTNGGATGRLWRISIDNGVSWFVEDFAAFSTVTPADEFRSMAAYNGSIYMITQEVTAGVDTEIWSVSATPGVVPDEAVLEVTFPELYCTGLDMDDFHYYVACATLERLLRVDRTTGAVGLLSNSFDLSGTLNTVIMDDIGGDGIADVLYLQVGTEAAYYTCDPAGMPYTDILMDWGGSTSNFGLGFDPVAGMLWAYDDDVQELVQIQ